MTKRVKFSPEAFVVAVYFALLVAAACVAVSMKKSPSNAIDRATPYVDRQPMKDQANAVQSGYWKEWPDRLLTIVPERAIVRPHSTFSFSAYAYSEGEEDRTPRLHLRWYRNIPGTYLAKQLDFRMNDSSWTAVQQSTLTWANPKILSISFYNTSAPSDPVINGLFAEFFSDAATK